MPAGIMLRTGVLEHTVERYFKLRLWEAHQNVAYADDVMLAGKAESIREAENLTNIEMGKIIRWAENNKMNFNENKWKAMLIARRKRKENKEIPVYMNSQRLEQVQTIRYLGIIIDSKLNFREHILCLSQVYKINTRTIKVGKTETGIKS